MLSHVYDELTTFVINSIGKIKIYYDETNDSNNEESVHIFLEAIKDSEVNGISNYNSPYIVDLKFKIYSSGTDKIKSNSNLILLFKSFLKKEYRLKMSDKEDEIGPMFYLIYPFEIESKVENNASIVKQPLIIDKKIINHKRS